MRGPVPWVKKKTWSVGSSNQAMAAEAHPVGDLAHAEPVVSGEQPQHQVVAKQINVALSQLNDKEKKAIRIIMKTLMYNVHLKAKADTTPRHVSDIVNHMSESDSAAWEKDNLSEAAQRAGVKMRDGENHPHLQYGVAADNSITFGLTQAALPTSASEARYDDIQKNPIFPKIRNFFYNMKWNLAAGEQLPSQTLEQLSSALDPKSTWGWSPATLEHYLDMWNTIFFITREDGSPTKVGVHFDRMEEEWKKFINGKKNRWGNRAHQHPTGSDGTGGADSSQQSSSKKARTAY